MVALKFEIFRGKDYLYYFRCVASNGEIIATSGDGYTTRYNCIYALNIIKQHASFAPIYDK